MNQEEAGLISRCRGGDQEALKEIYNRYREKVYRIAYGVVRQREDALDIVQEVFVKLYRSIGNYRGQSSLYTYVYRMAMNTAIDFARKRKKFTASSLDEEGAYQPPDLPEKRPEAILIDKELEEKVNGAMAKLPEDQRAAIIFREVEGLSYQEMADAMGCSIGTVMSRLHYGRKRLQKLLKGYIKEGGRA